VFRNLVRYIATLAVIGLAVMAGFSIAAKYSAPASEIAMLPHFCYAQYVDNVSGPEYTIHDCGPIVNHYCPALLELQRAQKAIGVKKKGERLQHLQVAKRDTLYTLNGIKGFPNCPIRQHVESTLMQVNTLLNVYGHGQE